MESESPTDSLPLIPNSGIELAFQLQAFHADNPHVTGFDGATLDLIRFIYTHYPVPHSIISPFYRSVAPEICPPRLGENPPHPLVYPLDWPIDRSSLSQAVRDLLSNVENHLSTFPVFVNWRTKQPVRPYIPNALGRPRSKRTKRGKSEPLPLDLPSELPFIPVVPAEPLRINSGLNRSLFGHPHTDTTFTFTSALPTSQIHNTTSQVQESPPLAPPVEAIQPLFLQDLQNPPTVPPEMPDNHPSPFPAMGTTSGPDIVALLAQLNRKMDSFQGKMDGFQGKMDTFQDKLTSLEEHQQPADRSPTHPPGRPMETRECNIPGWKPADIGFFYPDMPYTWGTAEVVDKEDKVYYRSVYAFTNRLRVAAQTKDPAKMSSNLDTCFRGEAARWWNNEVDELVRGGLIHTRDINNWCRVLEERFKLPPSQAMDRLDNIHYTIRDAANRRSVTAYVSSIVAAAKQCGETTEFQQVLRAWRHLDLALRAAIDEPKQGTTVKTFMDTLLAKQSNWFDIARRLNRRNDGHDLYTSDRRQPPYGRTTGQWRDGNFPRPYQRN